MNLRVAYTFLIGFIQLYEIYGRIIDRDPDTGAQKNLAGVASNIIAANILKTNGESNQNFVFSPFGYASILTILNEGAEGETFTDISSYLRYPETKSRVRSVYRDMLRNLQGDNPGQAPQFRTWLYVYKNNTINSEFEEIIVKDYFVDYKSVERTVYDDGELMPSADSSAEYAVKIDANPNATIITTNSNTTGNSKDIPEFETLKKSDKTVSEDEIRLVDDQKDASKFDAVVEDRQYVDEQSDLDLAAIEKDVKIQRQNDKLRSKLTVNEDGSKEAESVARKFGISKDDGDGASVLSGNSLVTNDPDESSKKQTKMLLFSGLYYRGAWETPFQQLRFGSENVFYLSESEKINTKMMRSRGYYKIAELPNLKCQAIEMPYQNERYSFLILLPNSRNGLKSLLLDFNSNTIAEAVEQLEEESVDVTMPKFNFDTTSGAEKCLTKSGLASIFTSKANFSALSHEQRIHVGELQQHVSIRVDEGSSSENFLTATNALRSNAQPERAIAIDRPFLFFVRDIVDDVIIVAGKLTSPPYQDEPIFSVEP